LTARPFIKTCSHGPHSQRANSRPHQATLKKFVDDISVLAIERCLIIKLPDLFSPQVVAGFDDAEVRSLAAESPEAAEERTRCTLKMDVLKEGMKDLRRLNQFSTLATSPDRCRDPVYNAYEERILEPNSDEMDALDLLDSGPVHGLNGERVCDKRYKSKHIAKAKGGLMETGSPTDSAATDALTCAQ